MGEVVPFQTKAERQGLPKVAEKLFADMTADERYNYLYGRCLIYLRDIAAVLQKTGRVTPSHEQELVSVVGTIKNVCLSISGTTGDDHGPTENVG